MPVSIVSPYSLKQSSEGRDGCTVIDARARCEYERGHVPGALWMGWEDWCDRPPAAAAPVLSEPGYWGLLENPEDGSFRERLAEAGVTLSEPLLVYGDGRSSAGREGRIAWMLMYLGAQDVSLLDGGWTGWIGAGGTAETSAAPRCPATPHLKIQPARRVNLAALRTLHAAGSLPCMLDTRSPQEFWGDCYDYIPRPGRLPASAMVDYDGLFEEDGTFVSRDKYLALLPGEVAGGRRFLAYCEVGVRAATFALLHEAYTGEVVPVFDGSLMEWSLAPELPVLCG